MTVESTRRIRTARVMAGVFVVGLVISGLTAMPVVAELNTLRAWFGDYGSGPLAIWIARVQYAVLEVDRDAPFLFYGYDWLAYGHLAIALAFVQAWRDPVRHRWLFDYGLVLCGGVIVWAVACGPVRGIPFGWTLVDCSFGVVGAVPLWIARTAVRPIPDGPADALH